MIPRYWLPVVFALGVAAGIYVGFLFGLSVAPCPPCIAAECSTEAP